MTEFELNKYSIENQILVIRNRLNVEKINDYNFQFRMK